MTMTRRTLLGTTILAAAAAAPAAAAIGTASYRDARAPVAARVQDLLSKMTLEEKAAQVRSMWFGKSAILDAHGNFSEEKAAKALAAGIGQIARPHDWAGTSRYLERFREVEDTVTLVNAIQRFLLEKTRLGIPALFHEEGAHGYLAKDA
ncbi:MAG: beta-glucosidase, partial [Novosphingobium sp.]|nr:beta-glucosidase [Novosphingobium sp.]